MRDQVKVLEGARQAVNPQSQEKIKHPSVKGPTDEVNSTGVRF